MLATDYVLGIDPGAKGAICLLSPLEDPIFLDMPTSAKEWRYYYRWLLGRAADIHMSACEDVHSLYGMSAKSNFEFGGYVRTVQTVTQMALGQTIPLNLIQPKVWQADVGLSFPKRTKPPERKKLALAHAIPLIGGEIAETAFYGPRGGLRDGRVDAYLIAYSLLRRVKDAKQKSTPA